MENCKHGIHAHRYCGKCEHELVRERDTLCESLRELVRLKRLKEWLETHTIIKTGTDQYKEYIAKRKEYEGKKDAAWDVAKTLVETK